MKPEAQRRVLVLVNPKSGVYSFFSVMRRAFDACWEKPGIELIYQFCQSIEDGVEKAKRAVESGVDTILVVGGDGTVSTIGRVLVGTDISLGVVPTGSGNGFARHFGIPLRPEKAVRALAESTVKRIDVGVINDMPFLITCSMAWDAAIIRSFEKSPIRGVLPYIFAGVREFIEYRPQKIDVEIDSGETICLPDPLVFTIANLTQYGGGAKIAPSAQPDDGFLELVVALSHDVPKMITNLHRLFKGSFEKAPEVITKQFQTLKIRREHESLIQVDGEPVKAGKEIEVKILPKSLNVLVPNKGKEQNSAKYLSKIIRK